MELVLQFWCKIVGHLPEGVAGCIADPVVSILDIGQDCVDHLSQNWEHLLLTALSHGRDGHQGSVTVAPVLWECVWGEDVH